MFRCQIKLLGKFSILRKFVFQRLFPYDLRYIIQIKQTTTTRTLFYAISSPLKAHAYGSSVINFRLQQHNIAANSTMYICTVFKAVYFHTDNESCNP